MSKYVIYYVYASKNQYLQRKYYDAWCSISAVMQFNKQKSNGMIYIGVAKLRQRKKKK